MCALLCFMRTSFPSFFLLAAFCCCKIPHSMNKSVSKGKQRHQDQMVNILGGAPPTV